MKRHEFWAIMGTGVALLAVCVTMWVTMWAQIADNGRQMVTRTEFHAGLQAMDDRFRGVDDRFRSVDDRFQAMDERFQAMDERFQAVEKTLAELVAAMERIDGKLDVIVPLVTESRGR